MHLTSDTTSNGVRERLFALGDIPGAIWVPDGPAKDLPLVLLGHGGGQHKKSPALVARARRYVTNCGFAVAAIDAPGHGDRPKAEQDSDLAAQAILQWRDTLDALQKLDWVDADGPVGYWGVSMGTALGLPFAATEPRIKAAVFGLAGHQALADAAANIAIPVEFLLQWDDELVPRESGLALFDAFASREKTLHANPGGHADVPPFELDSSERFFIRHLPATLTTG